MFANSEWFKSSSLNALPTPKTPKGWAFYAICFAGILAPATILVSRQQIFPEALIWIVFSVIAFLLEARGLRRDLREKDSLSKMYYIDDQPQSARTEQYDLELKKT